MAIGVVAKLSVKDGKNEEFEALFRELQELVNANEDGCNFYALHQSRSESQSYTVLEQYTDEQALDAHGKTEYFTRLGTLMGACMAAPVEVELLDSI